MHDSSQVDRRDKIVLAAVAIAVFALACQGGPIPLAAARGTTVLIPVGGGGMTLQGVSMGYGTETTDDWQRGRLRIWLLSNPDFELSVRGVSRVRPDRASPAGLSQGPDGGLGDQVVALVDIPTNAPLGDWPVWIGRSQFQWNGTAWVEQDVDDLAYGGTLEILDEIGPPTPLEGGHLGSWQDVSEHIPAFVPHPQFRFVVQSGATPLGSTSFTVTYPSSRAQIHAVVAAPIDLDAVDWGPSALISYSEPAPGTLEIDAVMPTGVARPAFSIVFELTHPQDPPASGGGPLTTADFIFSNVETWDVSGTAVAPTVPAAQKAIF